MVNTQPPVYHLQQAANIALAVLRNDAGIDESSVLATATLLERDYAITQHVGTGDLNLRTDNPLGTREAIFQDRKSDLAFWISVYRTASANGLHAAQLRSIQHLGSLPKQIHLHDDSVNTLLEALTSTVPAVRYAASEIVLRSEHLERIPRLARQITHLRQKQTAALGFPRL